MYDHGVPLVACEFCDLLHRESELRPGEKAVCAACGGLLYRGVSDSLRRTLALALTGSILFLIVNLSTFMVFSLEGRSQQNTIFSSVRALWDGGAQALSVLICFTTIIAPALTLGGLLYVLGPLVLGRVPPGLGTGVRFLRVVSSWSMLDVFMLAVIVSIVKLAMMARIELAAGAYAFVAMMVMLTAASASLDLRAVWKSVEAPRE